MTLDRELREVIWATRGRSWGFRFLLDAGLADPLAAYEQVFDGDRDVPMTWCRVESSVGVRFPDPLGRTDGAGRVIPHEFVVWGTLAEQVGSVDEARALLWPLVSDFYALVWDAERPPHVPEATS